MVFLQLHSLRSLVSSLSFRFFSFAWMQSSNVHFWYGVYAWDSSSVNAYKLIRMFVWPMHIAEVVSYLSSFAEYLFFNFAYMAVLVFKMAFNNPTITCSPVNLLFFSLKVFCYDSKYDWFCSNSVQAVKSNVNDNNPIFMPKTHPTGINHIVFGFTQCRLVLC